MPAASVPADRPRVYVGGSAVLQEPSVSDPNFVSDNIMTGARISARWYSVRDHGGGVSHWCRHVHLFCRHTARPGANDMCGAHAGQAALKEPGAKGQAS